MQIPCVPHGMHGPLDEMGGKVSAGRAHPICCMHLGTHPGTLVDPSRRGVKGGAVVTRPGSMGCVWADSGSG